LALDVIPHPAMPFVLVLLLALSLFFWLKATIRYLTKLGRSAGFRYITWFWMIFFDFFRAIFFGLRSEAEIPIMVMLHGVSLGLFVFACIVNWT
jgi:hypothetical protein